MFTVYKIINLINKKYYIGVHKTETPNDSYMGSGIAIKVAIKEYGIKNFSKEILFITEDKQEAFEKEKELTIDYGSRDNYNMRLGGSGGFTKENALKGYKAANWSKELLSENGRKTVKLFTKEELIKNGRKGGLSNKGKPKSEEHKQKLREAWVKKKQAREA